MRQNILIVDDDQNMTRLLDVVLKEEYSIFIANNIEEAKKRIQENQFHAMILDLNLNGESGYDMIKHVRGVNELTWLPILVLSGKEKSEDRIKCFDMGVDDYLTKPFNPVELKLRLQRNIEKYMIILQ